MKGFYIHVTALDSLKINPANSQNQVFIIHSFESIPQSCKEEIEGAIIDF